MSWPAPEPIRNQPSGIEARSGWTIGGAGKGGIEKKASTRVSLHRSLELASLASVPQLLWFATSCEEIAVKKLTFNVKLDGMESSEVAALSAPFDVEKTFGTRARVPVRGTINGYPFRSSLMPMGGCHRMVVNRELREGAAVKAGDTVKVVMERDEAPRTVDPPAPLKKELAKSQIAQANWEKQSFTFKKEMARSIVEVKQ